MGKKRAAKIEKRKARKQKTSKAKVAKAVRDLGQDRKPKEFRLKEFLIGKLRRSFKHFPGYRKAREAAKTVYFLPSKGGGQIRRVKFTCAECKRQFNDGPGKRMIAVDHKIPVVDPVVGFIDFNTFIERLFCPDDNLQCLCSYKGKIDGVKSCHVRKSAEEAAIRAQAKKDKKLLDKGLKS